MIDMPGIEHPFIGQRVQVFNHNRSGSGWFKGVLLGLDQRYIYLDTYIIATANGMYMQVRP